MTEIDRTVIRRTFGVFAIVMVAIFVAGAIADPLTRGYGDTAKAEGFFANLKVLESNLPRLPDGSILQQGELSSAWLDDVGALPAEMRAMPSALRGRDGQHPIGIVRRAPWSKGFRLEAKGSLLMATLDNVRKPVCGLLVAEAAKRPDQIFYIASFGDAPVFPSVADADRVCRADFVGLQFTLLEPSIEFRLLSEDLKSALDGAPKHIAGKVPLQGAAAPFQIDKGPGSGTLEAGPAGIRITINRIPEMVCTLALLAGPRALGVDNFQSSSGEVFKAPQTRSAADAYCRGQHGVLVLNRGQDA